jgi:hypothetical protein
VLRNLLTYVIRLGILAALLWLAWGWLQARRPKQLAWRWRRLGWQHKAMATALQERKRIAEVLRGSQLPVASSVMSDVDALVGSVADLVEVRLGLGVEQARVAQGSATHDQLAVSLARTDESLAEALRRLDTIRAVLLDHAADRLQDALADARERFAEHADQLERVAEANREMREELARLRRNH